MNTSGKFKIFLFSIMLISSMNAAPIARVIKAVGDVFLMRLGQSDYTELAKPGSGIENGDYIRVGETGFAVIIFTDDKSIIKLKERTEFQFNETQNTRTLNMEIGTILNDIKKENRTKTFRIETPVSVASIKGTRFSAMVDPLTGVDQFIGAEGVFDVFNMVSGQTVSVSAGQKAISNAIGSLIQAPAALNEYPVDPDPDAEPQEFEEVPEETPEETPEEPTQQETQPQQETVKETVQETTPEPTTDVVPEPESVPEPEEPKTGGEAAPKPFSMGLGVGSVTIDGVIYNQLAFRPEFTFGKLGIGLDVVLYIDNDGNFRNEEWDEASDIMDKFLYIRWGEKKDPFWIKVGALENVTLGYGGLLAGYSNMMEFPSVRRVGLNTGVKFGNIGTELFLANVKDMARGGGLIGLRTDYTVSKSFPLSVGANFVMDINQFSGLKDKDGDTYPDMFDAFPDEKKYYMDFDGDGLADNHPDEYDVDGDGLPDDSTNTTAIQNYWKELGLSVANDSTEFISYFGILPDGDVAEIKDPFNLKDNKSRAMGFAFDVGYPVVQKKAFSLALYSEFNYLSFPKNDPSESYLGRDNLTGTGITIPGLRANILKMFNLSVEYRIKDGAFVPQFFDQSYDLNRVIADYSGDKTYIVTKDDLLFSTEASKVSTKGYFGSASANLLNIAELSASYANMKADTVEFNSFMAMINLNAELVPKLSVASAYYQRNNDANPFDFKNPSINTVIGYRMGYEISKGVSLIWDFRQYYRDTGDGLKPIKQTTIETSMAF